MENKESMKKSQALADFDQVYDADIVIVGGGLSGFSAALTAAENGG